MEKIFNKVQNFLVAMNINEDERKVLMLLHFEGDYVRNFIDNAVPKLERYDETVEYLNKYLDPKTSNTFEIYKFQKIIQNSNETVHQFFSRLKSIANRCNFEN